MRVYSGETFAEVYEKSLRDLYDNPEYETSPRGLKIKENLGVALEIKNPQFSFYNNERRSSQYAYIAAEYMWYFGGRNDTAFISKYAKFWDSIQNPDGTANSAYGHLLFNNIHDDTRYTQYQWAIASLKKDKDSRQAIMHFNDARHQDFDNKDFVCTMYGIFHIRNNKLDFSVYMRSNDAILGMPTDVAFFTQLQMQALSHLKETYPELELGKYTHNIDSFHIYERNFDLVKEMLQNEFIPVANPVISQDLINEFGKPNPHLLDLIDNIHEREDLETYKNIMDNGTLEFIHSYLKEKENA